MNKNKYRHIKDIELSIEIAKRLGWKVVLDPDYLAPVEEGDPAYWKLIDPNGKVQGVISCREDETEEQGFVKLLEDNDFYDPRPEYPTLTDVSDVQHMFNLPHSLHSLTVYDKGEDWKVVFKPSYLGKPIAVSHVILSRAIAEAWLMADDQNNQRKAEQAKLL